MLLEVQDSGKPLLHLSFSSQVALGKAFWPRKTQKLPADLDYRLKKLYHMLHLSPSVLRVLEKQPTRLIL